MIQCQAKNCRLGCRTDKKQKKNYSDNWIVREYGFNDLLNERPQYQIADGCAKIFMDDPKLNGLVGQLEQHMSVWTEPCLIRLTDILRKTSAFNNKKTVTEYTNYLHANPERSCLRHYTLPESHVDYSTDCECIFCRACRETVIQVERVGFNGIYIAEAIIHVICRRTKGILVRQVQLEFQEIDVGFALDERMCYGFRNAIPAVGSFKFESLFKGLYRVGVEVVYEIVKKLAVLIRYNPSYENASDLLTFFVKLLVKLSGVVRRLRSDLEFFEQKIIDIFNIDLTTFFLHIFDTLLYSTKEFQLVIRACRQVVSSKRRSTRAKLLLKNMNLILPQLNSRIYYSRAVWQAKDPFPFVFEEYIPVHHNVFKIALLRNPFVKLRPNDTHGYEIIRNAYGELQYRIVSPFVVSECELAAEPLFDLQMTKPGNSNDNFHIRVVRRSKELTTTDLEDLSKSSDASILRAHGLDVQFKTQKNNYFTQEYLVNRNHLNLDEVEGPLPEDLQDNMNISLFQRAENDLAAFFSVNGRRVDRTDYSWPPWWYVRKRRLTSVVRKKKLKMLERKILKCKLNFYASYGRCLPKKKRFPRFLCSFGGRMERNLEPKSVIMEAQKSSFINDIMSSALQLGITALDKEKHEDEDARYFVLFKHNSPAELAKCTRGDIKFERLNLEIFDIIKVHYDILAKYDIISLDETKLSPQLPERIWGNELRKHGFSAVSDELTLHRLEAIKDRFFTQAKILQDSVDNIRITARQIRREQENLLEISDRGHIVGFASRASDIWKPDILESDSSIDSLPHSCPHKANNIGHHHTHSGACRASENVKAGKCGEHEKKSRPGLPLSAGYAEKRQTLRMKLARERKEKELLHLCEEAGCPHCSMLPKTKNTETVTVGTQSPILEDIDELVNIIEGNLPLVSEDSRKNSAELNEKKAAKKARKKERKEQKKLEQEEEEKQQKLEEERIRKQEEEERLKKEEAVREEELRKKREKRSKKKKNKNKKDDVDNVEHVSTRADEEKQAKQVLPPSSKPSKNSIQPSVPTPEAAVQSSQTAGKKSDFVKPEMVTIRRHATAPDTTVTISVKSDNGEEDVLYTLINGQVVRADGNKNVTSNGSQSQPAAINKVDQIETKKNNKKKNKKNQLENDKTTGVQTIAQSEVRKQPDSVDKKIGDKKSTSNTMTRDRVFGTSIPEPLQSTKSVITKNNSVDVKQLKLPPGITITKLNESSGKRCNSETARTYVEPCASQQVNAVTDRTDNNTPSDDYSMEEQYYNENDFYYYPKETGEFEEVVSNKTRRLRNRVNKQKDGQEGEDDNESYYDRNQRKRNSIDNASDNNENTKAVSNNKGKRSYESTSGANSDSSNRYRRTSGNGAAAIGTRQFIPNVQQKYSGKHQTAFHANPSNEIVYESSHIQNGRGGKYVRTAAATMPRLQRSAQPQIDNNRKTPTGPSHQISYVSSSSTPISSPQMRGNFDSFHHNSPGNIAEIQPQYSYPKPIKKPTMDAKPNLFGNVSFGETPPPHTDFAQYNPWGETRSGQRADILESLLKDLHVKEGEAEKTNSNFPYGFGSTNTTGFDYNASPSWGSSWNAKGSVGSNGGGLASDYSIPVSPNFTQNNLSLSGNSGFNSLGLRAQTANANSTPLMSFGIRETDPGISRVIQRPRNPTLNFGSQCFNFGNDSGIPVPGVLPQFDFQNIQDNNSSLPNSGQKRPHQTNAEYSLF